MLLSNPNESDTPRARIHILKAGSTIPFLAERKGDFEHWIMKGMGVRNTEVEVVDVAGGFPLPNYDLVSGIVITGSHAMVTEHHDWSEATAEYLRGTVGRSLPVLGICYGHQLLAYALGGEVCDNPNGGEFGTVEVHLNGNAECDRLFSGFANPMKVHVSHAQSVVRLPDGARRLGSSAMDKNQAFTFGDSVWGVQFHPEFDAEIVVAYITAHRDVLLQEAKNPDELIRAAEDTPYGAEILKRFVAVVGSGRSIG